MEELAQIQQRIDSGFYTNQYTFEADFQLLAYALNDGHVTITAGILSAFTFGSPFEITSVSTDGKELPKLYFTGKILVYTQLSVFQTRLHLVSNNLTNC